MSDLGTLDARFRPMAEAFYNAARRVIPVRVTSARRNRTTQRGLYIAYVTGKRKLPALPPGHSQHERGLAWDMVPPSWPDAFAHQELAYLGAQWKRWGGRWGGPRDPVHFEAPGVLTGRR